MSSAAPFLLVNSDFSKIDVVKAYAHTIVAPAIHYWRQTIEIKKGDQVARMKAVRICNPLHVMGVTMGSKIVVGDIDNLKLFKLSQHPDIRPRLEGMKEEISKYNAIASFIKSLDERFRTKG
jgi:hypothetical protein